MLNLFSSSIPDFDIEVTDTAIASLVEQTVLSIDGVSEFSHRFYNDVMDGITERFGTKRVPGITIKHTKKTLKINIYIIVALKRNFIELSNEIKLKVYTSLNTTFQIKPDVININIEGVNLSSKGDLNGKKSNI